MPSWTTPTFSKMPLVTSQLTQPATLAICHASGSADRDDAGAGLGRWPTAASPIVAVLTSSSAFITESVAMKRVVTRMCAAIASVCSSMTSRT